jgi:8-oxo-dGTP diphosphatase
MIRRFDEFPCKDKRYVTRHGVYAIIKKERKLLITFQGDPHNEHQLPGGGVDVGESHLQTLHREALEETGWIISPKRRLGAFQRFTYMPEYNLWARKVCHIYFCRAVMGKTKPLHDDHSPLWINPQSALNMLYNSGDKHFVALAINLGYFKDIK